MRCTKTFNEMLSYRGILPLKLRNSAGNISAGLAKIDGTVSITCKFIFHMGFQILIIRWFKIRNENRTPRWTQITQNGNELPTEEKKRSIGRGKQKRIAKKDKIAGDKGSLGFWKAIEDLTNENRSKQKTAKPDWLPKCSLKGAQSS